MTIPIKYRKSPEVGINYDFADILADVGYVTFYGLEDEATGKKLSRQAVASSFVSSTVTGTTGNIESNFDYEFLLPAYLKGDMFVTITLVVDGSASTSATNDTTIEIIHERDGTETSIGTQQAIATLTNPVDTTPTESRNTLTFAIDKRFTKGDKLRIEVISTVAASNVNSYAGHYHDGANRDFTLVDQFGLATYSNLIVQVPFSLAL